MKVREYIHRYNYTYNPDGVFRAIKYMYTYWPDPRNTTHIRQQLINVKPISRPSSTSHALNPREKLEKYINI